MPDKPWKRAERKGGVLEMNKAWKAYEEAKVQALKGGD